MVSIHINGKQRELDSSTSVADLVELLELTGRPVAVEVNRAIVPRRLHSSHLLEANDEVEIVTAVGGG